MARIGGQGSREQTGRQRPLVSSARSIGLGARVAVGALTVLGTAGASLIVAYGQFSTAPKRGGQPIVVAGPEAYLMVSIMYCVAVVGVLILTRAAGASRGYSALALCAHAIATAVLVRWMA